MKLSQDLVLAIVVLGTVSHVSWAQILRRNPMCCADGNHIKAELGPLLSEGASISLSSSPEWEDLVERATSPRVEPSFVASIEAATEEDVQMTVRSAVISIYACVCMAV